MSESDNLVEIRQSTFLLAVLGGISGEELYAIQDMTRSNPQACPVNDINGNPIILGELYTMEGSDDIFRMTKCVYGSGNMVNTYYRVYGLSQKLIKESYTVCVNGEFNSRTFESTYDSKLTPHTPKSSVQITP